MLTIHPCPRRVETSSSRRKRWLLQPVMKRGYSGCMNMLHKVRVYVVLCQHVYSGRHRSRKQRRETFTPSNRISMPSRVPCKRGYCQKDERKRGFASVKATLRFGYSTLSSFTVAYMCLQVQSMDLWLGSLLWKKQLLNVYSFSKASSPGTSSMSLG